MVSRSATSRKDVHLVVLIHGLWGNPKHLEVAREELQLAYERAREQRDEAAAGEDIPELRILVAQGNEGTYTYDGIDVCAVRVAKEIDKEVGRIEKDGSGAVKEFSVMGYSVGGLIARYLIGLLHSRDASFLIKHRPVNFTTLATPHVGIVKYRGRFWQWVAVQWGYSLLGRTGDQLYTWDKYSEQDARPLLEVMSDADEIFIKALNSFQRIDFFANAVQDYTVPYPTGAINYDDPFVETPAKSSVEEEVVVETDDAGIIKRWYTIPVEDGVRKENNARPTGPVRIGTSPHTTSLTRRPGSSRALSTGNVKQKRLRLNAKRKRPQILPPFLVFPRPFNWILYATTPIFMPIFMVGVVIAFVVDSGRSRRRAKAVTAKQPLNDTIAAAVSLGAQMRNKSSGSSSSGTSSPNRIDNQHTSMQTQGAMDTVRMRLNSAARSMSNNLICRTTGFEPDSGDESDDDGRIMLDSPRSSASSNAGQSKRSSSAESSQTDSTTSSTLVEESPVGGDDGLGSILNNIRHWSGGNGGKDTHQTRNTALRPPTSRMQSMVADKKDYKTSYDDKPYPHPAHDSSASPHRPDLTEKKDVKLELTDVQRRIIRNLNEGIDPLIWRKWLTWFPMVSNAHAAISVRDGRKFPEQEHGRGVVRRWAENTVMHKDRKA
ncbi:hypothetical protein QFC21_005079 [Naganishia friedmannii]|uniref:Uncharacterized protein n=1 Tax=Naganishia friedmannii TaxID=89922 RepID=A0ACC2VCG0_9TREE|nr:hypothetical protein QFC21_005079 [Naganishia friedmannii]